ncbi:hypothetical protein MGBLKFCP_01749 [Escherichia coli]|uniref:ABC-three component system middle component 2 n=2 Tax=Escherichia coli TaxID=562 RepID=UPI000D6F5147|nr:ABC-three component system middle component 2 [Escherichia coli]RDA30610.1 hypothetical protein DTL79_14620 [Escherichia coli]BDP09326.1 hypothetical protein TUM13735_17250 [Escherichia coli]
MSEMQVFEGNFEQRPFNTPLEYGFRALFILDAADNVAMDLQRIVSYDYLNRPGFPGECFICELRLPDHRF